ncbi:MAG: hypothetical protein WEB58_01685 [Planctomycetaceae bacterium]
MILTCRAGTTTDGVATGPAGCRGGRASACMPGCVLAGLALWLLLGGFEAVLCAQEVNPVVQDGNRNGDEPPRGQRGDAGAASRGRIGIENAELPRVNLREILVPADRPEEWPAGDWQPMSRRDFVSAWKLLRPRKPGPQPVWIERAQYSAVFAEKSLRSGRGSWVIHRHADGPQFLEIEPMGLAVSDFQSSGNDALWGAAPSGRNVMLVADDRLTADFSWTLEGLQRRHSVVFDVHIPPATTSVLRLHLPEGMRLESSVSEVSGPVATAEAGWNLWEVDLGQATSCRLTVRDVLPTPAVLPQWMIRQQTTYVVRQEGAEIITDLNVETTGEPVDRFQVPIPAGVDVYSVSYGNDPSVLWSVAIDSASNENVLTVKLPDPVRGPLRQIRINGFAEAVVDQDWQLPIFRMSGLFLQGGIQLTIEPPLQLNEITTQGCRLQKTSTGATTGTTYQLVQNDSAAGLTIQIAFPAIQLSARVLHHLAHESSGWSWAAEMSLRSRSGSTYQIRNLLPVRWDIAEVQLAGPESDTGQILKWTIEPATAEHQWLILDVAKAVDGEHPLSLRLRAKQTPGTAEDVLSFPYLEPQACQLSETVYAVHSPGQEPPHEQLADGMQPASADALSANWSASPLYRSLQENAQPALWFATSFNSGEGTQLEFPHVRQGLTGTATVEYEFLADRLFERYFIFVEPVSEPIDRILVYVSGTGPEFEWEQLSDRVVPVDVQRLPGDRHQNWNLPAKGELWEIRLPEATQEPIRLRAQRIRYHAGQAAGQLVFLPQSKSFRGTIELHGPKGIELETVTTARTLQNQEVISQDQISEPSARILQWEYDDVAETFEMHIKPGLNGGQANPAAMVHLQSRIFADGTGENQHRVRFDLLGDVRSVEFVYELPSHVNWIATRVNGQEVQPQYRGTQHVVSMSRAVGDDASATRESHQIEVEYQEPAESIRLRDRMHIPLPRVDVPVIQFDWDVLLPDGYFLESIPRGLNGLDEAESFGWKSRWFGPLGRSRTQHGFNPFDSSAWRGMYHRLRGDEADTADGRGTSDGELWQRIHWQGRLFPAAPSLVVWNESQLTWIGWFAFWCTLLIGGAVRIYTPSALTGVAGITWWSLLLAAVWFAPAPFSVPLGGIAFGSILIACLPSAWMHKAWFVDRRVPVSRAVSGSEDTVPIIDGTHGMTGSASLMILLVLSLAVRAGAQTESGVAAPLPTGRDSDASVPTRQKIEDAGETWDVLVPFSLEGESGDQNDLVYLKSDQAVRLAAYSARLQSGGVDYLITSAEYLGHWDRDNHLSIEAKFRLAVFADAEHPTTVIDLPIRHVHLARESACIVDGKSHPIFAVPERNGFTIELKSRLLSPAPPPLPEEADAEVNGEANRPSANASQNIQLREVTLLLHPVVKQQNDGGSFLIEIPAVSQSQFRLAFAQPPADVRVNDRRGDLPAAEIPREFAVPLGRQTRLAVSWNRQPQVSAPVVLSVTHQSLLEFSPTVVRGQSRVHHRTVSGSVRDVLWDVPAGVVVEKVTTEKPSTFEVFSDADGGRRLLVEFAEPVPEEFVVDVEWLSPVTSDGSGRISISPLSWLGRAAAEAEAKLEDVQAAVAGLPGYELLSSTDEQMILRDIPAEEFYKKWGLDGESRRTAFISSFVPESRIAFELRPLRSVRKARQDEIFHFTRQRVQWSVTIEVETSQTPALVHEIVLDPAIQLEEISVKQDEAERLSHFIRQNDRLKLILKDLTSSTQLITLRGFLPAMIGAAVPLPRVHYQADVMDRATVAIRHDAALRLDLTPDERWQTFSADQDVVPPGVDWATLGRFVRQPENQSSEDQPAERQSIRSSAESMRSPELSHFTALKPKSGKTWIVRMLWHVEQFHGSQPMLRIELPAEVDAPRIVSGPTAKIEPADAAGGSPVVTFVPDAADPAGHVLVVEGEWTIKGDGSWAVPVAALRGGDVTQRWLMISPRDVMRPQEGSERQVPEEMPLWSRPVLESFFPGNIARLYSKAEGAWTLTPAASREQQAQLTITWMRSECRFDASTGCMGRTEICAESAPGRVLRIDFPAGSRLVAVLLNGATLSAAVSERGELAVPLGTPNSSGSVNVVDLIWQQPIDASWRILLSTKLDLPRIKEFAPERHFIEIITSPRQRRLAIAGMVPLGELEYHLDLAEQLSNQVQNSAENSPDGNERLRRNLVRELRFLNDFEREESRSISRLPAMSARWRALRDLYEDDLAAAAHETPDESLWLSTASRSGGILTNDFVQGEWIGAKADSNIVIWWIDARWYLGLLAAFAFGLTWFALRKVTSWTGSMPWDLSVPVFAIGLTLVWWLFLEASLVGFCLFVYAVFRSWKQWRTPAARAAT